MLVLMRLGLLYFGLNHLLIALNPLKIQLPNDMDIRKIHDRQHVSCLVIIFVMFTLFTFVYPNVCLYFICVIIDIKLS
jgi:hypothetical protein